MLYNESTYVCHAHTYFRLKLHGSMKRNTKISSLEAVLSQHRVGHGKGQV
jgi:hypothetical protein